MSDSPDEPELREAPPEMEAQAQEAVAGTELREGRLGRTASRLLRISRGGGGGYQIIFGNRVIADFCSEFEEWTGWRQPPNTYQQVHIIIDPAGQLHQHWGSGVGEEARSYFEERDRISAQRLQAHGVDVDRLRGLDLEAQMRLIAEEMDRHRRGQDEGVELAVTSHPDWRQPAMDTLTREMNRLSDLMDLLTRI